MKNSQTLRRKVLTVAILNAVAQLSPAANAALITVDATDCTLDEAINSAQRTSGTVDNGCVEGDIGAIDTIALQNSSVITIPRDFLPTITTPIVIEGNSSTLIGGEPAIFPPRIRIFDIFGSSATVTINDLTISGGQLGQSGRRGAGMQIISSAQVTLNNSTVSGNSALDDGGGILINNASLTLNNTTVSGNTAEQGAGIHATSSVINVTNNSTFSSNSAKESGGAIYATETSIAIMQSELLNNHAYSEGGAIQVRGSNVTITDSQITANSLATGVIAGTRGGGISLRSNATATLSNTELSGNSAGNFGGGVHLQTAWLYTDSGTVISDNYALFGGGIFAGSSSNVSISENSSIYDNIAGNGSGGGFYTNGGSLTISNSMISTNSSSSSGGAISATRTTIEISDAILNGNTAAGIAGGVYASDGPLSIISSDIIGVPNEQTGSGVRVRRGDLHIIDSTISGHSAGNIVSGGAVYFNSGSLIIERSRLLNSSGYYGGGIHIRSVTEPARLDDVEVRGNQASRNGGGISLLSDNVSITRAQITQNSTQRGGGGVAASFSYGLTITDSLISNNISDRDGGGLYLRNAELDINSSTISSNTGAYYGGGVHQLLNAILTIVNSTISGNSTTLNSGGALRSNNSSNQTEIIHTTLSNNTANENGGAIDLANGASLTLIGSIVAGNIADNGVANEINNFGVLNADHNNLFGSDSDTNGSAFVNFVPGPTDINSTQDGSRSRSLTQILQPLADNGGLTPTHAIGSASPAIDRADRQFCIDNQILTDQRGVERMGQRCDIGSFEGESNSQCFVVPIRNGKTVVFCL